MTLMDYEKEIDISVLQIPISPDSAMVRYALCNRNIVGSNLIAAPFLVNDKSFKFLL